jgi:hypothetical protein
MLFLGLSWIYYSSLYNNRNSPGTQLIYAPPCLNFGIENIIS